ncbi:hypothetical protein [Paraburkholderia youngii]|uniref:hypothetical protein n=1 Tax=Paraburkholderia youngii TaxID=2782701 RepID=UPI003D1C09B9
MSSPTPEAQSLEHPHSWRDTATYLIMFAFRLGVVALALWAARFTIEREHAWVDVADYHHCAPVMGTHADGFAFGCAYSDVSVRPSLLRQTYQITAPDGSSVQTHMAAIVVDEGVFGVFTKTPTTWLLYAIAAIAIAAPTVMGLLRSQGVTLPERFRPRQRTRFAAMALTVAAAVCFFAPTLREALTLHRIESSELDSKYTDVTAFATAVQTKLNGDLLLLGTDNYDRAVRLEGYGCRLYTERGVPIPRSTFPSSPNLKLSTLPGDTRFVGGCFFPQYDHALGSA